MTAIIFPCIMKSHLSAKFMRNFTTISLSIAEILLFTKRWSKIAVSNIAIKLIAYLCPADIDVSLYVIFE